MSMELPLEHCAEYDSAAEWCAIRGLKGEIGDPLPCNMETNGALKYIQADPEAFQKRVREFAYSIDMNRMLKRIHAEKHESFAIDTDEEAESIERGD